VREGRANFASLKAIVFDVDGTLYRQNPLRRAMFLRLLHAASTAPMLGLRTFRVLSAYRQTQEQLRGADPGVDLAEEGIRRVCERTKTGRPFVAACVARWMEREPLALLTRYTQPGLPDFLRACKSCGLRLGVLSDYPAEAKLEALGLDDLFDVVLCAQSGEIRALKPSPRGLQVALERLGVGAEEALYVGDRADVDAAAAEAAGVRCAILTRRRHQGRTASWIPIAGYPQLHRLLEERFRNAAVGP
jgi:HAD superfamily hydrolase (TIGR01549 family)